MTSWLVDTSVAVPLVQAAHAAHRRVGAAVGQRTLGLPAHAAIETYSVLTRLPGDARLTPADALALIRARFDRVVPMPAAIQRNLVQRLAEAGIAGGAVYDALIAITSDNDGATLLTRDSRAAATYEAMRIAVEFVET